MRRASAALIALLFLTACPAPRRVSGIVYAAGTTEVADRYPPDTSTSPSRPAREDGRSTRSAILPLARAAREKNPELRAVIKADASVPHGRVIHVLDLLKQAQVSKIAFGVNPL